MAATVPVSNAPAERLRRIWETPAGLYGELATVDHKTIGKRYIVTAFLFLLIGGAEAGLMRAQLARPSEHLVTPEVYNQLFSMHGLTMMFWYASPILSGFSNYMWPLLIGARDMAYPRVNALSYWTFLLSGIFLYTSPFLGQSPNDGWFAYAPYSLGLYDAGLNMDFYALGLIFLGISTTVGAVNFIGTIINMRCPGLSLGRLPVFMFGTMTASFSIIFALDGTHGRLHVPVSRTAVRDAFLRVRSGRQRRILWQHLFWMFGHPWVYVVVLPAMGMISDIIPVFSRRPLVGYVYVAGATVATGVVGFAVWVHHMFATGMSMTAMSVFSGFSFAIAIPSAIAVTAWIATVWTGRPVFKTPMLFALGFVVLFVIGGVSGVVTAAVPYDWQVSDSYFIVAHIHYVLIGINVFAVMAALYFWVPKITGRMLGERLGRWNFWTMFVGMNIAFFPMHIAGILGMARRVYTYPAGAGLELPNLITSVGAAIFVAGVLLFLVNFGMSVRWGALAGANPWDAATLEWSVSSPPPPYNFAVIPTIRSRDPLWEGRVIGEPPLLAPDRSSLFSGPVLDEGRQTMTTSAIGAEQPVPHTMPDDSPWPLVLALAIAAACYGLLFGSVGLVAAGVAGVAISIAAWLWPHGGAGAATGRSDPVTVGGA